MNVLYKCRNCKLKWSSDHSSSGSKMFGSFFAPRFNAPSFDPPREDCSRCGFSASGKWDPAVELEPSPQIYPRISKKGNRLP